MELALSVPACLPTCLGWSAKLGLCSCEAVVSCLEHGPLEWFWVIGLVSDCLVSDFGFLLEGGGVEE